MTLPTPPVITIMVVNCQPEPANSIQPWLGRYSIHLEKDCGQAIAALAVMLPDLIMVDVSLPDKRELDVCKAVRENSALGFIPVIAMVGPESGLIDAALDAGADDVLVRPIQEGETLARIGVLLRMKRRIEGTRKENQRLTQELEKRDQEIKRAQRASQEASVLKDSIVRNVSHELRTPLLQVKSSVAMLADDARAAAPNGVSVLADMAIASTARLESVVQNITQLAASLNVKTEPFKLTDAINFAIRQMGRQWASSGGVDRIKVPAHELPLVMGDRGGISQVLQQLLDNAIKFSPAGGPVEIMAERRENAISVSVRDSGIGIPEDQREQIFQAFYQVDSSPTRSFGGTGVGLAIVKLLIDTMGLTIQVQSKPGAGSTFSFNLPIAELDDITVDRAQTVV